MYLLTYICTTGRIIKVVILLDIWKVCFKSSLIIWDSVNCRINLDSGHNGKQSFEFRGMFSGFLIWFWRDLFSVLFTFGKAIIIKVGSIRKWGPVLTFWFTVNFTSILWLTHDMYWRSRVKYLKFSFLWSYLEITS